MDADRRRLLDTTMPQVKVMLSAAYKRAYLELVPEFERGSGHKVENLWVPSVQMMGRLKGGETVDLVILSAASLDELRKAGLISDRTDLARSGIGVAVKSGARKPDLSSGEAGKRAVLAARGVGDST